MKSFKPRASSVGKYMACPARLYYDRTDPQPVEHFRNKYMSFGTIVHYEIQKRLGCIGMEEPANEDYIEAEPMLGRAADATAMGYDEIAKAYPGVAWNAEQEWKGEGLTGHTDLVSTDGRVCVDIKTTTKPPARGQVAVEHYWQLLAYHLLTGCTEARVLYVSSKAEWVSLSDSIEFASTGPARDLVQLSDNLRGDHTTVVYGSACTGCPHVAKCRDAAIPRYPKPREAAPFSGGAALAALAALRGA